MRQKKKLKIRFREKRPMGDKTSPGTGIGTHGHAIELNICSSWRVRVFDFVVSVRISSRFLHECVTRHNIYVYVGSSANAKICNNNVCVCPITVDDCVFYNIVFFFYEPPLAFVFRISNGSR